MHLWFPNIDHRVGCSPSRRFSETGIRYRSIDVLWPEVSKVVLNNRNCTVQSLEAELIEIIDQILCFGAYQPKLTTFLFQQLLYMLNTIWQLMLSKGQLIWVWLLHTSTIDKVIFCWPHDGFELWCRTLIDLLALLPLWPWNPVRFY